MPQALLKPLLTKQKAAIRIISLKPYNAHTEPLFKFLSILPLQSLIDFFKLKFMHNYLNNSLPTAFTNTWPSIADQRLAAGQPVLNLRNNNDIFIPPSRLKSMSYFPLYNFPVNWNNLPDYLKSIPTKLLFKANLKHHFLSILEAVPTCNRLFCPSCSNVAN